MIVQYFVSFYFSSYIFCLDLPTAAFCYFSMELRWFFTYSHWLEVARFLGETSSNILPAICLTCFLVLFYPLSISWFMLSLYAFFRFGIFNPTIVYDHLGEIFSTLIFGSFIFCIFLYIKVRVSSYANCHFNYSKFTNLVNISDTDILCLQGSLGPIFHWFWFMWKHNNRLLLGGFPQALWFLHLPMFPFHLYRRPRNNYLLRILMTRKKEKLMSFLDLRLTMYSSAVHIYSPGHVLN